MKIKKVLARSEYRENEKIITSTSSSILQPTTEKATTTTTTTTTTVSSTVAKTEPTDPNTPAPSADQVELETPVSGGKRVLSALRYGTGTFFNVFVLLYMCQSIKSKDCI